MMINFDEYTTGIKIFLRNILAVGYLPFEREDI